ncbi:MAG: iron-containing alcohol dehydrogenase [Desulfovibrionaceae bacterium]|jgi:alcohol dehydrogenase class IV|nr:iron-containing alcohol dehydrogenase [Desulfovibrionaceae bacterium]
MTTSSLLELRKFVAPEFVFGAGAAQLAGRYAGNLGARRVLLVTDSGLLEAGWAREVQGAIADAGVGVVLFSAVSPNPRDHEVMAGAEVFAREQCDGIVAVGGGSPMDCAKAIGAVYANERHVLEFEGVDRVAQPGPPLICIPTTAGSSADVSQFAIVTDTKRKVKIAIVSKTMVPDAALIDPVLTTTMDRELTADTGLDALTHAVEAYVSNANGPVTDLFAREAVRHVAASLVGAMERPGDLEARSGMMLGSMYAGLAFSNAILGAVHAMAHSLGGLLDLPHGLCNAILLDHVIDYNFEAEPARYGELALALDPTLTPGDAPEAKRDAALRAVRGLKRAVGVTATLGELGVTEADLDGLARNALNDPCMTTNPRAPSLEDVKAIYAKAL